MTNKIYFRFLLSLSLIFSIFVLSLPLAGRAQTSAQTLSPGDLQKGLQIIEEKTEARRKELGIPGMSLVIVKDGQIIFMKGFGYRDFENKIPVTPDTEFAIGSSTKAFTALSVLMSQDEGKLSLDDSPKKVLPYFKINDPEIDKAITIRDLMSHSSGLNRTDLAWISGKLTREEIIKVAGEAKPTAKLHEKFQYQNVMFTAAGEIVAQVQKQPWEKFIPERIFKPLGMTNSTMSMKEMAKTKDYSLGYDYNFDTSQTVQRPFRDADEVAPAGSINSSVRDMAKWLQFIQNGGTVNGKRLVSEKGFEEWMKPQMKINARSSYGLGWFLRDWNGLKVVEHGGNIDGFNAQVAMIPEKKLGFVMLTNVSASSMGAELMPLVWSNILGAPKPSETTTASTNPPPVTDIKSPASAREFIGKYESETNGRIWEIKEAGGQVMFQLPGQPPFVLGEKGKDTFTLSPLPENVWLETERDDQGKIAKVFIVQPEGRFGFKSLAGVSNRINITVDELMAKTVEAAGGEANWRKLNSRVTKFELDLENQGVKANGTSYAKAPDKSATETTMVAFGKTIATGREYFDGTGGEEVYSFGPSERYAGRRLEDARLGADFYGLLNWKTNYKKVEIERLAKVGDEECYVVNFEPEKGTRFSEYYSTKTFLLLKHDGITASSTGPGGYPFTVTFSDYREVDGVKLPFKTVNYSVESGNTVTYLKEVKHNVPIDDKVFAPRN